MVMASSSQALAAAWAVSEDQSRATVMAVSAVLLVAVTVVLFVKRPTPHD